MSKGNPPQGVCRTCRRPWKEIATKYEYWFREIDGIEYACHTVGSGVTKSTCYGIKNKEDSLKVIYKHRNSQNSLSFARLFEGIVATTEANSLQVLNRAGLLNIQGEDCSIPGGNGNLESNCEHLGGS
jgi:hypothetical protein